MSRLQRVLGVDFCYQPPPRAVVPCAAALKGQAAPLHLPAGAEPPRGGPPPPYAHAGGGNGMAGGGSGLPPRCVFAHHIIMCACTSMCWLAYGSCWLIPLLQELEALSVNAKPQVVIWQLLTNQVAQEPRLLRGRPANLQYTHAHAHAHTRKVYTRTRTHRGRGDEYGGYSYSPPGNGGSASAAAGSYGAYHPSPYGPPPPGSVALAAPPVGDPYGLGVGVGGGAYMMAAPSPVRGGGGGGTSMVDLGMSGPYGMYGVYGMPRGECVDGVWGGGTCVYGMCAWVRAGAMGFERVGRKRVRGWLAAADGASCGLPSCLLPT